MPSKIIISGALAVSIVAVELPSLGSEDMVEAAVLCSIEL